MDSCGDKHVVRRMNVAAVEGHFGNGIEALERKHRLVTFALLGGLEGRLVHPGGLANPLYLELILANVGIWDQTMVHQVEMDHGRELGDGAVAGLILAILPELPVLVDGDDRPRAHLAG